jgi:hypothetical protein
MKDIAVYLIYATAVFITGKYFYRWWNGELNNSAIFEWFGRGFFFAWGVLTATAVLMLIVRLIVEGAA